MQWLAEICVRRPVFATVLSLLIVVLGIQGYSSLGVDRFPNVDFPFVIVTTILPGASPEDVEQNVTDPIEAAVNTVGAIDELRSISAEGVSVVIVQFDLGVSVDNAAQDVRDRVGRVTRNLPAGIEPPVVAKLDPDAVPVVFASVNAPGRSQREVTEMADTRIRAALETLPGVGQVNLIGGEERAINVLLDPVKLQAFAMSAGEVAQAVGNQNLTIPGGRVDTGRDQLTLRIHGKVERPEDLGRIVIRAMGERTVRVEDVGRVEDSVEERSSIARWNGEPTVVIGVQKQSGANTVAVADAVREAIVGLADDLPPGFELQVIRDESGSIRTGTDGVREHLVVGSFLAAFVVLLFLGNARSTLIAALAIPTSVLGTFAVMNLLGYSLNTITLLALALSVGIVIDDAIVVLENIVRHVDEKGKTPMVAAVEATKEIGLAVMATTLSLVAVFLPVVFLAGIPGRFLRSFGITMSIAILVSLFVSFTLTPMLSSRWLVARPHGTPKGWLERITDAFYSPIERLYLAILGFCLRWRFVVVVASLGALLMVPVLGYVAKKSFLPIDDQAQFEVLVRVPEGRSLVATSVEAERIAREIRTRWDGVVGTLVTAGVEDAANDNVATIYVRLTDPRTRELTQEQLMDLVRRELLANLPEGTIGSVSEVSLVGGSGAQNAKVQYYLVGPDLDGLAKYSSEAATRLREMPGAVDVDTTLVIGKPELGVFVDRDRAASRGVTVLDVAQTLSLLVGGQKVGAYDENGQQYDVRVRADAPYRGDADVLALMPVRTPTGGLVPLGDLVRIEAGSSPSSINRLARQRVVTVVANPGPGYGQSEIGDALEGIFDDLDLPSGYRAFPAGQTKLLAELMASVLVGFGLAFIFMYLVLAAQFESWVHPFTILVSLPLTLPFALFSIVITGQALDMFSVLGIFVLFGIVKKNAILQVDHTIQLRAEGMPRTEAILLANRDRLRPILMTTVAFVAGMLPLALSEGVGSGFNRATSGVVVGGQTLSLLLTLLATPVVYTLFDDAIELARSAWRAVTGLFRRPAATEV
jgi:HAE1 family hydrophobic/amphiphilic exporter-1